MSLNESNTLVPAVPVISDRQSLKSVREDSINVVINRVNDIANFIEEGVVGRNVGGGGISIYKGQTQGKKNTGEFRTFDFDGGLTTRLVGDKIVVTGPGEIPPTPTALRSTDLLDMPKIITEGYLTGVMDSGNGLPARYVVKEKVGVHVKSSAGAVDKKPTTFIITEKCISHNPSTNELTVTIPTTANELDWKTYATKAELEADVSARIEGHNAYVEQGFTKWWGWDGTAWKPFTNLSNEDIDFLNTKVISLNKRFGEVAPLPDTLISKLPCVSGIWWIDRENDPEIPVLEGKPVGKGFIMSYAGLGGGCRQFYYAEDQSKPFFSRVQIKGTQTWTEWAIAVSESIEKAPVTIVESEALLPPITPLVLIGDLAYTLDTKTLYVFVLISGTTGTWQKVVNGSSPGPTPSSGVIVVATKPDLSAITSVEGLLAYVTDERVNYICVKKPDAPTEFQWIVANIGLISRIFSIPAESQLPSYPAAQFKNRSLYTIDTRNLFVSDGTKWSKITDGRVRVVSTAIELASVDAVKGELAFVDEDERLFVSTLSGKNHWKDVVSGDFGRTEVYATKTLLETSSQKNKGKIAYVEEDNSWYGYDGTAWVLVDKKLPESVIKIVATKEILAQTPGPVGMFVFVTSENATYVKDATATALVSWQLANFGLIGSVYVLAKEEQLAQISATTYKDKNLYAVDTKNFFVSDGVMWNKINNGKVDVYATKVLLDGSANPFVGKVAFVTENKSWYGYDSVKWTQFGSGKKCVVQIFPSRSSLDQLAVAVGTTVFITDELKTYIKTQEATGKNSWEQDNFGMLGSIFSHPTEADLVTEMPPTNFLLKCVFTEDTKSLWVSDGAIWSKIGGSGSGDIDAKITTHNNSATAHQTLIDKINLLQEQIGNTKKYCIATTDMSWTQFYTTAGGVIDFGLGVADVGGFLADSDKTVKIPRTGNYDLVHQFTLTSMDLTDKVVGGVYTITFLKNNTPLKVFTASSPSASVDTYVSTPFRSTLKSVQLTAGDLISVKVANDKWTTIPAVNNMNVAPYKNFLVVSDAGCYSGIRIAEQMWRGPGHTYNTKGRGVHIYGTGESGVTRVMGVIYNTKIVDSIPNS